MKPKVSCLPPAPGHNETVKGEVTSPLTVEAPGARTALGDSKGNENISEGFNEFLEFLAWKKTKQNDML